MEILKVVIQSLKDVKNGKPIVEGLTKDNIIHTKNVTIGILESGTVGGQSSLMFILKTPDGKHVIVECTQNHFEALIGAYQGAQARFEREKNSQG